MNISMGNFLADVSSNSTTFFASLSGVVTLIIGILLAFWIISFLVRTFSGDKNTNGDTMNEA
jgi:hypothetical protein